MGKRPKTTEEGPSPARREPLPKLEDLHLRHYGLDQPLSEAYSRAARVCLSRHHSPPADFHLTNGGSQSVREVAWEPPDDRTVAVWGNRDDATRDGAYVMAIAAVEVECGIVAISRTEVRTGADYFVAPVDADPADLEEAVRLEVSGTDAGGEDTVRRRLREKVQQTKDGIADTPALACVVGFSARRIAIEEVDGS